MTADRLRAIITRALHPRTPVEEARTSAMIALRDLVGDEANANLDKLIGLAADDVAPDAPEDPPFVPVKIRTRYDNQYCYACGRSIYRGEFAIWARSYGLWHPQCAP